MANEEYRKSNLVTIQPLAINNITREGSSRDFEGMYDDFLTVFPLIMPEYSSLEDDDYGVAIVQFVLWMIDNLNYQLDFYVQQRTHKWCRSREALRDILEWFRYSIPSYAAAVTDQQKFYIAVFPSGFADGIAIPAGTWVQSSVEIEGDYVDYETDAILTLDKKVLTLDTTGNTKLYIGAGNTTNYQVGYLCEINDDDTALMTATLIATNDLTGELEFDTVIPATYTVPQNAYVAMLEGVTDITEGKTYTDPGISANGRAFQEFSTVESKVIDGTIVLKEDGTPWPEVTTLLYSDPDDEVFEKSKTIDHMVVCRTGDDYAGKSPTGTIVLSYRVGGGRRGNLGKNLIRVVKDTIFYHGNPVSISTTNLEATKHGGEQMTVERAKLVGPATIFSLDRAVTEEDFEALLENYPGVSRVSAVKKGDNAAIFLLGNGVTAMTQSEKEDILDYLEARRVGADGLITLYDPTFVTVYGTLQVKMKDRASIVFNSASAGISEELSEFFDPDQNSKLDFGKTEDEKGNLYSSDIYNIADDDDKDVEYALIPIFTIIPTPVYSSGWPVGITITSIAIGDNTVAEKWTIQCMGFHSDGFNFKFSVLGSVSGLQTTEAKTGTAYVSDNQEIGFTITYDAAFDVGDSALIKVLPLKNEFIPIDDEEFPVQGTFTITEVE